MTSTDFSSLPPEPPLARFALPFLALSLGGLYLAGRIPQAPTGLAAVTAILGLGYLPGLALVLPVERRFGLWAGWVLPLILSPLLVTVACLAMTYFGASLSMVGSWVVVVSVAVICFSPPPQREIEDRALTVDAPGFLRHRGDRGQVLLLAALVLSVLAVMYLGQDAAVRQPAAALQRALVDAARDGLPPADPLLAGLPYRGPWAWSLYLALLTHTTQLDPGILLTMGALVSAFTLVFTVYRCLGAVGLDHPRAFWGAAFVLFALAPPAWTWFQPAAGAGERFFLGTFLNPGGHCLSWSLAGLVFWSAATFRRGSRGSLLWAFLGFLGLWLFAPAFGALWSGLLLLAAPVGWVVCRLRPWGRAGLYLLVLGLLGWAAAAAAYPYLRSANALGHVTFTEVIEVSGARYLDMARSLHWVLILGFVCLFAFLNDTSLRRQLWAVWGVLTAAVGFAAIFGPPGPEYAAHLLFAPAAGSYMPWLWRKAPRLQIPIVILLVILALLANATGFRGWARSHPSPDSHRPLAQWIKHETPPTSVFITLNTWPVLLADRSAWFDPEHVRGRGYRSQVVLQRRAAYFNVLSGKELDLPAFEMLQEVEAPLYWMDIDGIEPQVPWEEVARVDGAILYRWSP